MSGAKKVNDTREFTDTTRLTRARIYLGSSMFSVKTMLKKSPLRLSAHRWKASQLLLDWLLGGDTQTGKRKMFKVLKYRLYLNEEIRETPCFGLSIVLRLPSGGCVLTAQLETPKRS
jgi:hypothetical protein